VPLQRNTAASPGDRSKVPIKDQSGDGKAMGQANSTRLRRYYFLELTSHCMRNRYET
jgi:hypothetical protein